LAERILTEQEVMEMIAHTKLQRDKLLRLLYASAGRVSEVCALCWKDAQPNGDSGQVTLYGKGDKTRTMKVSKATWHALQAHRRDIAVKHPSLPARRVDTSTLTRCGAL
jgi:integrase/recombinase XerD